MRVLLFSIVLALPAVAAEPAAPVSEAAPTSESIEAARRRPRAPVPKGTECTKAADCSCAEGQGRSCLNGRCGCHDPIIIEAVKP